MLRNIGGRDPKSFRIDYGGGAACAPLLQAALAVHSGLLESSCAALRVSLRTGLRAAPRPERRERELGMDCAVRAGDPGSWVTGGAPLHARLWRHQRGLRPGGGRLPASCGGQPARLVQKKPISLAQHQASRWIVEPLRRLDCCQESDGAVAIVVTRADRARHLRHRPALIRAAVQGAADKQMNMTSFYRAGISSLSEMRLVAGQLYAMGGVAASDIQTAVLYDHFSPFVLPQLEAFGFCPRGEGKDFIRAVILRSAAACR